MYFEDEKDIIDDNSNLHIAEDGTVSWDDILTDQDGDVEMLDDGMDDNGAGDVLMDDGSVNDAGGVESIKNDYNESEIQYDDDPLNSSDVQVKDEQSQFTPDEYSSEESISDDFDIDKQLEQVSAEGSENENEEFTMPSKEKKKSNSTAILLALLIAVMVMAGVYYYFTVFQGQNNEVAKPQVQAEADVEDKTADADDNSKQEDLSDKADDSAAEPAAPDGPIPIVNDDNVKELTPEKPKEEKKQIISIIPTGRINPFLPLQKYSQVNVHETIVQYDKVGIPTPPVTIPKKNDDIVKMLTIAVSGIMYDEEKPSAIITLDANDYFVQKGDKLDDYRVVDIGRNFVTVALGNNLYKANVGEEFKISSKIYGSAQYLTDKQGGGRQYYSLKPQEGDKKPKKAEPKKADGAKYVSEDDVIIKTKEN